MAVNKEYIYRYKYRSFEKEHHLDIISKGVLWFASPLSFNDPFDCRIPDNWSLLNTPDKISEYVDGVLNRHMKMLINLIKKQKGTPILVHPFLKCIFTECSPKAPNILFFFLLKKRINI